MIEAQIICSAPCDLPDLGIFGLRRGEERWVSVLAAEKSRDLEKEQRKGNVRWFRKSRRIERAAPRNPRTAAAPRPPPPPFVARSRPSGERPQDNPPAPERVVETVVERVVEVSAPVDTEALARQMKAEILGDLLPGIRAVVQEEVGKASGGHGGGIDPGQLEGLLESVMRRVMPAGGGAPAAGSSSRAAADADEPLFFPSEIVDKDAKSRISVKTETGGEAESLDDAQRMLREIKRRGGGGRTKENEEK